MKKIDGRSRLVYAVKPKRRVARKLARILIRLMFLSALFFLLKAGQALLVIDEIDVTGLETIDRKVILEKSEIKLGSNLVFLRQKNVKNRLLALPGIAGAVVRKVYPSTVEIVLEERLYAACVLSDGIYWVIDAEGFVYDSWDYLKRSLPVITGIDAEQIKIGSFLENSSDAETLVIFLSGLSQVPYLEPAELNLRDRKNLILYTADGRKVLLGDSEKMSRKLILLFEILPHLESTAKGIILDLRTGDRLVVVDNQVELTG